MNLKNFDIAIIGSGPGGYVAAIIAAQFGKKVALIEEKEIGGTCLNIGCIPTKTLLTSAFLFDKIKKANEFGIKLDNLSFDFAEIQKRKDKVVENIRKSLENLIRANNITIFKSRASFLSSNELLLKNSQETSTIQAEKIIIATGSEPSEISSFPFDGTLIHSSTSILNLKTIPKSIAIIGGGYIGCEFASFFSALGVEVSIIEARNHLLMHLDEHLSEALEKNFNKRKINILTSCKVLDIQKKKNLCLILDNKKIDADLCLIAIGRKVTPNLNLENANVKLNDKNEIIVNEKMQTNISNIYAIGDVTGKIMLAHVASHQGIVAAFNACGINKHMNYDAVPSVTFTIPEIASVGLSEKEAKERNIDFASAFYPLSYLGRAIATNETEGFVKVIMRNDTKQIIGAHMFGEGSSTMISEMALAITNELTLDCIKDTIHTHPTLPEAWMEAIFLLNKTPLHFPPLKKNG